MSLPTAAYRIAILFRFTNLTTGDLGKLDFAEVDRDQQPIFNKDRVHSLETKWRRIRMEKLDAISRMEQFRNLPVSISVRVCGRSLKLDQLLDWAPGTILSFDQAAASPLEMRIGDRTIADGLAIKVGQNFGIQVRHLAGRDQS